MVTKEECLTGKVIGAAVEDEGIIVEEIPEGKVKEIYYGNPSAYVRIHNVDGTVDYEAAFYETMFDYACEASIEHYAAEGESDDPEYLVEEFKLSEDPD